MADQFDKIVNEAIREIKSRVMSVADDIGMEIAEKIQGQFDTCVDAFYKHYKKPLYYDRFYNTYEASDGEEGVSSHYHIKQTKNGIQISAGITVDSSFLYDDAYKDGVEYVFPRTWEQGIHGTKAITPMSPSPKEKMDKWWDGFKEGGFNIIVNKHLRKVGLSSSRVK